MESYRFRNVPRDRTFIIKVREFDRLYCIKNCRLDSEEYLSCQILNYLSDVPAREGLPAVFKLEAIDMVIENYNSIDVSRYAEIVLNKQGKRD